MTTASLAVLALGSVLCLLRIAISDRLEDRIVALDLLLVILVVAVIVWIVRTGETAYLDVLVVGALVFFIGSVVAAQLVGEERKR